MAVDGSGYRRLTEPANVIPYAVWSPDSRSILFVQGEGQAPQPKTSRIMRMSAEGGKVEYTGITSAGLAGFDLSPDGTRIVLSGTTNATTELWAFENISLLLKNSR
jgi:Tol biopolymer transport system component